MQNNSFFERPILNSPYDYPLHHWELDETGQPTHKIINNRRPAKYVTPVPKHKKQKQQLTLSLEKHSTKDQEYDPTSVINSLRERVDRWREIPDPNQWRVTPETARLLNHWRNHKFIGIRPFFCQVEAVEVAIWLTEVAPQLGKEGRVYLDHLERANREANPEIMRLALKLATGAGKTTVMAMLIAWQTINAVRRPTSKKFTRGFLVVTPGLTIKDRLRVLKPNDPDSYYQSRELVPHDMLPDLNNAKIVITNYHSFKLRERLDLSKGGRALLQGRTGDPLYTLEKPSQMLQRVMPELMGFKGILAINDEAHHCYRAKSADAGAEKLTGDEKAEAQQNNETARLWISGLEIANEIIGLKNVIDLSATPFFLRGSGYKEGTLFPWVMSDFSLMDAIECGIVKLPRVPVSDNIPNAEMPVFRNLWENIRGDMPKKTRDKFLDPQQLPTKLHTALEALYGHYEKTFNLWCDSKIGVPPCFIIVCNNTSSSKLVYDYISGYHQTEPDGSDRFHPGKFGLFSNYDEHGNKLPELRTLLIDSAQLESGEKLDDNFRRMEADAIERFRNEIIERTGDRTAADNISDQELLREVMNTVGKENRLGASIRCVVSVSMLTEGWDANTVTHVLGVRAFGTQLLCEQVIGRALRRQSYELNDDGLFNVEYADVFGIPFDFNATPAIAPPQKPRDSIRVKAMSPERDDVEITFPNINGYTIDLPQTDIRAHFTESSQLVLNPDAIGPTETENQGIVGEAITLNLAHTNTPLREQSVEFKLTHKLVEYYKNKQGVDLGGLFTRLKAIVRQWKCEHVVFEGGTYPAQLLWTSIADRACEKISAAIESYELNRGNLLYTAIPDPYNPESSTRHVNFTTTKLHRWQTDPRKCHINWVILDSSWEAEFCRVAEAHPRVKAYVKNHNLGFKIPYTYENVSRTYYSDFILLVDDGHGDDDLLHLVIEVKGFRDDTDKAKKETMETKWIHGVNKLGQFGRWKFAEFTEVFSFQPDLDAAIKIQEELDAILDRTTTATPSTGA